MPLNLPKVPDEPFVDKRGVIVSNWLKWIVNIFTRVYSFGVSQTAAVALVGQAASVGSTPLSLGDPLATRYRVGVYAKLTEAAGATSSLQVSLNWTDPTDGTPMQWDSPTLTGNVLTDAIQVDVPVDANQITYSTTYSSTGVPVGAYKLTVTAEALPR